MKISAGMWRHARLDAAGAGACAALTALFYFAGVAPLERRQAADRAGQERLCAAEREAEAGRADLAGLERRLESLRRETEASPLRLDRIDRMNARMADLNRLAGENGLEIDELKPGPPENAPWFTRVPLRIAGSGPYRACVLFLHRLNREFPDMGATAIELRGDPSPDDTPALFTFDLVWFAAASASADATK